MTKRGTTMEGVLVLIVIFGVVMIVLAVIYQQLFLLGDQEFSKAECRNSLLLTRGTQERIDTYGSFWCVQATENFIPLKCSRKFLTVTADDVLQGEESMKYAYNPTCPDVNPAASIVEAAEETADDVLNWGGACLVENVFAKEMAQCWNTFLEGETPVFQQVEPSLDGFWDDNEHTRGCFVCAEVTLDTGSDVEGFTEYLETKDFVNQQSYYEYIARNRKTICNPKLTEGTGQPTCWDALGEKIETNIIDWAYGESDWPGVNQDTFTDGQTYAVTFVRYGMESKCEENEDRDDMPALSVQVLPANRIHEYCDAVMV